MRPVPSNEPPYVGLFADQKAGRHLSETAVIEFPTAAAVMAQIDAARPTNVKVRASQDHNSWQARTAPPGRGLGSFP
jgi:hypothetical protein